MNNDIKNNSLDVVLFKKLISNCDLHIKDKDGWTPLTFILFFNEIKKLMFSHDEIIQLILKAKIESTNIFLAILDYDLRCGINSKERLLITKKIPLNIFIKTLKNILELDILTHNLKSNKNIRTNEYLKLIFYDYSFQINDQIKEMSKKYPFFNRFIQKKELLENLTLKLKENTKKEVSKI